MTWERFVFCVAGLLALQAWRDLRARVVAVELGQSQLGTLNMNLEVFKAEVKLEMKHLLEGLNDIKETLKTAGATA